MGRKSSAKSQAQPSAAPSEPKRSFTGLIAAVAVLGVIVGGVFYWRQASVQSEIAQAAVPDGTPISVEVPEVAQRPHHQATLPRLQFPGYPMPRSAEVVAAAYK